MLCPGHQNLWLLFNHMRIVFQDIFPMKECLWRPVEGDSVCLNSVERINFLEIQDECLR